MLRLPAEGQELKGKKNIARILVTIIMILRSFSPILKFRLPYVVKSVPARCYPYRIAGVSDNFLIHCSDACQHHDTAGRVSFSRQFYNSSRVYCPQQRREESVKENKKERFENVYTVPNFLTGL